MLRQLALLILFLGVAIFAHGCHGVQEDLDIRQRFVVFAAATACGAACLFARRLSRTGPASGRAASAEAGGSSRAHPAGRTNPAGHAAWADGAAKRSRAA